ncbi:MAG: hypothetical protein NZ911_05880 [Sulfolobales archaeon]|nr:hypothetical protein [Sulfolobales archaeon]
MESSNSLSALVDALINHLTVRVWDPNIMRENRFYIDPLPEI